MSESETDSENSGDLEKLLSALTKLQRGVAIAHLGGMRNYEAYRSAGGTSTNKKSASATVTKIIKHPDVAAYLEAARNTKSNSVILSRDSALEILSSIAQNDASKDTDKIKSIHRMSSMQGWDAPVKQSLDIPRGSTESYTAADYEQAEKEMDDHFDE